VLANKLLDVIIHGGNMNIVARIALIVVIGSLMAACGGVGEVRRGGEENVGPYPTNWKEIAASYIQNSYLDPRSVVDSEAAPPFRNNRLFFDAWTVCIRNNAKNQFGGYTGRRITELGIKHGQVVTVDDKNDMFCRNARFEPLPLK